MKRVYLDNGATSYPKAPGVGDRMKYYLDNVGCNINRSGYTSSFSAEEVVYEAREMIAGLFNFTPIENVIFTMNITQSLNFLLKGLLKTGDHCIVSSMEHNAVMRPLMQLSKNGVEFSRVQCDTRGRLNTKDIYNHIRDNTRAVIMTHVSNVCGTILPLEDVGRICKQEGLAFIIDSAQSAGILDVDFIKLNADAIAFTGHKGLLGPQGIGGFLVSKQLAQRMESLVAGGTGSLSEYEEQPPYMPDKFEAGTMNIPGIFGLHAALQYIQQVGIENIRKKEMELAQKFLEGAKYIKGVEIIGLGGIEGRTAVVSLDFEGRDNAEIAYQLDKRFGIATRCGLHCAPSAHKTLGTFPRGTVRFSFSHFNSLEEVQYTLQSIEKVLREV